MISLRYPYVWLTLGWLLVAGAIIGSLSPLSTVSASSLMNDKIQHLSIYALLMIWFAGLYPRARYPLIALGLFLLGIAIEWLQGSMRLGRESDLHDVAANTAGIAAGFVLALMWLGEWARKVEAWFRRE